MPQDPTGGCAPFSPPEKMKYYDLHDQELNFADSGIVHPIFNPLEGFDDDKRVGRATAVHSITLRGVVRLQGAELEYMKLMVPQQTGRLIIFADSQCGNSYPQVHDVLEEGPSSYICKPVNQYNRNNRNRFLILYDRMFNHGPMICTDDGGTLDIPRLFSENTSSMINEHIECNIGQYWPSAGSARPETGGLFMLLLGEISPTSGQDLTINFSMRTAFTDDLRRSKRA